MSATRLVCVLWWIADRPQPTERIAEWGKVTFLSRCPLIIEAVAPLRRDRPGIRTRQGAWRIRARHTLVVACEPHDISIAGPGPPARSLSLVTGYTMSGFVHVLPGDRGHRPRDPARPGTARLSRGPARSCRRGGPPPRRPPGNSGHRSEQGPDARGQRHGQGAPERDADGALPHSGAAHARRHAAEKREEQK